MIWGLRTGRAICDFDLSWNMGLRADLIDKKNHSILQRAYLMMEGLDIVKMGSSLQKSYPALQLVIFKCFCGLSRLGNHSYSCLGLPVYKNQVSMAANESYCQTGALGNLRDFDDTVKALEGLVHADCRRSPEWITSAAALADLYHTKFEFTGELRYLSLAIRLGEECAMTMTSHQAGRFYHLANWMVDRYLSRKQLLRPQRRF